MEKPHPLAGIVKDAGLSQKEFAALGGWLPSSVNRWLRQRGTDARPVPRHVRALALAYRLLTKRQREALLAELERTASADDAPPGNASAAAEAGPMLSACQAPARLGHSA